MQRQLHEGFVDRDRTIQRLNEALARQSGERQTADQIDGDKELADNIIRELNRRLTDETARRERKEQRLQETFARLQETERELRNRRVEFEAVRQELNVAEQQLAALTVPGSGSKALNLFDMTLLYVGGRMHQVPMIKAIIERSGARPLHHDGGIEHSLGLLPGLVSRAHHILFPVDCVSHEAVATIKRLCQQSDKKYEPLRNASLTCLLSTLVRIGKVREGIAAQL